MYSQSYLFQKAYLQPIHCVIQQVQIPICTQCSRCRRSSGNIEPISLHKCEIQSGFFKLTKSQITLVYSNYKNLICVLKHTKFRLLKHLQKKSKILGFIYNVFIYWQRYKPLFYVFLLYIFRFCSIWIKKNLVKLNIDVIYIAAARNIFTVFITCISLL